jgi:hypothetical protein
MTPVRSLLLGAVSFGLVLGLYGCRVESDDGPYNQVGELQVFDDAPAKTHTQAAAPLAPRETVTRLPLSSDNRRSVTVSPRHVRIGEMDMED